MAAVMSNAPEGKPFDYVDLWVAEHYSKGQGFLQIEKRTTSRETGAADDINFQWGIGPILIKGTINLTSLSIKVEVGITVPIFGYVKLASASGNLKDGIKLSFDVAVASGSITLYMKNGNELWVRLEIKSIVGDWHGDYKIMTIPLRDEL